MTKVVISKAIAPVEAEIIPEREPVKAITTQIANDAYKPTLGSSPAIMEKAIASGMSCLLYTSDAADDLRDV